MNTELHAFLKSCDVKDAWEYPPGADWEKAIAEVERLKPELERILGINLRLDKNVQDASFFADLGLLIQEPSPTGVIYLSYQVCFRFSWFAKMFTIFGSKWEQFDTSGANAFLKENGFTYIPSSELDTPYDGVNEPFEEGLTWWTRYFDYS